ncbi:hypothetical protein KKF32_04135 [Patescibacteria group bacterium]|nr:hypothetical protein [Patescibacteria group bacterium]
MSSNIQKYFQAVNFLEAIVNLPIPDYLLKINDRSFFIERLRYFLNLLDNPQKGFKYIHVTGTAGKGSTANLIHEILNVSGYKVGSYFSPHPTTSIERIKVNDLYLGPWDFTKLIDQLKPALQKCLLKSPYGHPSYFETFLGLAFLYFKQKNCEYVILESGLGGKHDATNIIKNPLLTIITNINHDHQKILGRSLKTIASDKAGIIKKGSIFITAESRPSVLKILKNKCDKVGAKFHSLKIADNEKNISLVKKVGEILKINPQKINQGIAQAKLPCRFEIIQKKPLIILDGSHNPAKLKYLKRKMADLKYCKLHLILGMAADKNLKESLNQIVPLADKLWLTRFLMPYRKTADLKKLHYFSQKINKTLPIVINTDPCQTLKHCLKYLKKDDCLLITGSFFLTGELRKKWISEEYILKNRKSFKT